MYVETQYCGVKCNKQAVKDVLEARQIDSHVLQSLEYIVDRLDFKNKLQIFNAAI